jgi:hypothetical protein
MRLVFAGEWKPAALRGLKDWPELKLELKLEEKSMGTSSGVESNTK